MSESKIQAKCYQWFNNTYCLKHHYPRGIMFSVPNELAGSNSIATMQAKAIGLTSGVSDTIAILPNGKILFIEFKDDKGRQSEKQKDFESIIINLNYEYHLIRDFETFKSLIHEKTTQMVARHP